MRTKLNLLAAGTFLAAINAGFSQATIQFSTASSTVAESAGTATLSVRRANDISTLVSVDFATEEGTATSGLNYTATNGTLTFGPGVTNQTLAVPILNNGLVDGTKTFMVILSNPANAALGTPTTNTVFITDNDAGVAFVWASYSVAEEAGAVQIGVVRGDDGMLPMTVDLATADLTATSGLDYAGANFTLSFAATERFKRITIPILNDSLKETSETFRVTLSHLTNGTFGSSITTTITIVDNDPGIQFESTTNSVAEDAGAVLIDVTRSDATNSTATVDYATSDVTAISGSDYTGTTNTLSFAPGVKTARISIPILNDGFREAPKTFRVTLGNSSGGILGTRTTTTITIQDNDPGVGFESATSSVWEGAGEVNVIVLRGNDWSLGPITVDYATSDITAAAGGDYQACSGTLQFQENETIKSLTVPILRDALVEGAENFRVTLSNATGGAMLGTTTITVTIQDNYFTVVPPFDSRLRVRREGDLNLLSWTGGGQLQRADRVEGPWQTLTAANSPCAVQSRMPASFYKIKHPRPVTLYVPSGYEPQTPLPFVMLLHGRGGNGQVEESYMKLRPLAETRTFLYCYPDATDSLLSGFGAMWGCYFWDDADAAAFGFPNVDDVGYLRSVIEEIARRFAVDRKRVYVIGGSNGGVMAYRMACECADLVAGIASRDGPKGLLDYGLCQPSEPVNILHYHGTADTMVPYWGGATTIPFNAIPYPSAIRNLQDWAGYNGCSDPVTEAAPSFDSTTDVPGLDTVATRYLTCPPGSAVELWTIYGASHKPTLTAEFSPRLIDWLLARPKP